jgi:hypothetical protein
MAMNGSYCFDVMTHCLIIIELIDMLITMPFLQGGVDDFFINKA